MMILDYHLIQRFNEGDAQAFKEVYHIYYTRLCLYARRKFSMNREEVEEIISEAFVRLFKHVQKGKQFETSDHIRNFLFTVAHNEAVNHLRLVQRQSGHLKDFINTTERQEEEFNDHSIEFEMMQIILTAIERLPPECRRIFKMLYLDGLSYRDVAAILKLSPQTVRNQKSRALMLIRKHILKAPVKERAGIPVVMMLTGLCLAVYLLKPVIESI